MPTLIISIVSSVLITLLLLIVLIPYQEELSLLISLAGTQLGIVSVVKDILSPVAASFGGAVAGAWFAFRLQNNKEKIKQREDELMALNRTALALESQINHLGGIKKASIVDLADEKMRFMAIQTMAVVGSIEEKIDIGVATVLIKHRKPELLQKIRIAERRYANVISVLRRRDAIKQQVDSMTLAAGINILEEYSLFQLFKVIGPNKLSLIYKMTEEYISLMDKALITLDEAMRELSSISIELYSDVNIGKLFYDMPDENKFILRVTKPPFFKDEKELLEAVGYHHEAE